MLSRESILSIKDITVTKIDIPEWGGFVYIKPMSGIERDSFESLAISAKEKGNYNNLRVSLLVNCICDETGKNIFNKEDIVELNKKNAKIIVYIFEQCQKICGLSEEDIEQLEKNS